MTIDISPNKRELAQRAASHGAQLIREAIAAAGSANILIATGASQLEMLEQLVKEDVEWPQVTAFHLDEYIGMPATHLASFHRYLEERFVNRLPRPLKAFHFLDGEGDVRAECARVGALIRAHPVDVAFIGIGENGHLAFNDPPADFETEEPYLVVHLDEACRRQQWGEGWFESLDDVPRTAISISIRQILSSRSLIVTVPDARKAQAVKNCLSGPVTPQVPGSILQTHPATTVFLDPDSASLLPPSRS